MKTKNTNKTGAIKLNKKQMQSLKGGANVLGMNALGMNALGMN